MTPRSALLFLLALPAVVAGCATRPAAAPDGAAAAPGAPITAATSAAPGVPASVVGDVAIGLTRDAQIAAVLADIDPARIRATDSVLVSFGTRHTMSDTLSDTRGIGAARRWIHGRLEQLSQDCGGCLRVEYDPAMITVQRDPQKRTVNVVNVLAWLPGRDTSRVVVMGGHYDSCVCSVDPFDVTTNAPGADDDGSGTSAVMELARVFSQHFPHGLDATVLFVLYAGEEQGLLGSRHLAQRLHDAGYTIVAGMTDDMDGNISAENGDVDSTEIRVYSGDPDNSPSRELARYVWGLGTIYQPEFAVRPTFRLDRIHRGGDHIPYFQHGDAAVRFSEPLENYTRQHRPGDVMAFVSYPYVARVARINAATVASLAAAPPPPDSVRFRRDAASGGRKWELSWHAVPGATGYEVLVRRTTAPTYQQVLPVGSVTRYLLDAQLDDAWAAVRSVDAAGHRSLQVAVPAAPPVVTR